MSLSFAQHTHFILTPCYYQHHVNPQHNRFIPCVTLISTKNNFLNGKNENIARARSRPLFLSLLHFFAASETRRHILKWNLLCNENNAHDNGFLQIFTNTTFLLSKKIFLEGLTISSIFMCFPLFK